MLHALGEHLVQVGDVALVPHGQGVPSNPSDAPVHIIMNATAHQY